MLDKITIYTLQFLDLPFTERQVFLAFINRHIHTFALKRQSDFLEKGSNAKYFHNSEGLPILINSFIKDSVLTVRAYTEQGINALKFWCQLFKKDYPNYCQNIIESKELMLFKGLNKPLIYSSDNWIPYRRCDLKNKDYYFFDRDNNKHKASFKSRLVGNYRTFIKDILNQNGDNIHANLKILNISRHKPIVVLIKKGEPIEKYSFKIKFEIYAQLPFYFSLGQNVGYGNGVFSRVNPKSISYETLLTNVTTS